MTKLQKSPITCLLEQESLINKVNDAKHRFRFKPFYEKYKGLNVLSKILQYVLPCFSVATGTLFLSTIIQDIVPFLYISILFAIALIVFLEYSKNYVLDIAFTDLYAGAKNYSSFLISLVLCFLSGFVSLNGVKELHSKTDTQVRDLNTTQASAKDSLIIYYDSQINQSKERLISIPTNVTWQKSVDDANSKQIQNLSDEITMLQKQKSIDLASISTLHSAQKDSTLQATGFNLSIVIVIILLVELIILIANWFMIFYDFKTSIEAQILTNNQNTISLDSDNFKSIVSNFILTAGLASPSHQLPSFALNQEAKEAHKIGFSVSSSIDNGIDTEAQKTPKNSEKGSINTGINTGIDTKQKAFLEAYKFIIEDLGKGLKYSEILGKRYQVKDLRTGVQGNKKISKTTLQNIQRVIRNTPNK